MEIGFTEIQICVNDKKIIKINPVYCEIGFLLYFSEFKKTKFYLCHMNYFYKTDKGYCPAELALAEFNLEHGLTNSMHMFLDPG